MRHALAKKDGPIVPGYLCRNSVNAVMADWYSRFAPGKYFDAEECAPVLAAMGFEIIIVG
jgi:hypothetical protein